MTNFIYTKLPTKYIKLNKAGEALLENLLKFTNCVPFVIYADFGNILKPIQNV